MTEDRLSAIKAILETHVVLRVHRSRQHHGEPIETVSCGCGWEGYEWQHRDHTAAALEAWLCTELEQARARIAELGKSLRDGLDHLHPITCASMDGFEDSGKPCDCWHDAGEKLLSGA